MTDICKTITDSIVAYTAANSGFETKRPYVSLSQAYEDADQLFKNYTRGYDSPDQSGLLRCYKGYQMERDLILRMEACLPGVFTVCNSRPHEISSYDGLVKGHPDFIYDGIIGDIKSVPADTHLPSEHVPNRVYYQMQAYLAFIENDDRAKAAKHWGLKSFAIVVYESRESGLIRTYKINANQTVQSKIRAKIDHVVARIRDWEDEQKPF